ncbi:MAG: hypothetical protein ACRDRH_27865, partial [Pseudonocardia sp.]
MLKKAGIVVAMATAGLLAVSPLAFATGSVVDQENEQESEQGNGILNGNNIIGGNSVQLCDTSVAAIVGVAVPIILAFTEQESGDTEQGRGDCTSEGEAIGQNTEQDA